MVDHPTPSFLTSQGIDARSRYARVMPWCLLLCAALLAACPRSTDQAPPPDPTTIPRIRLWHTFNPAETEALNRALEEWPHTPDHAQVEATLIPFARGQTMLRQALRAGDDCPDLARVDATWLPALVAGELVQTVPDEHTAARKWLPEAVELATVAGRLHGLPQSLDGLALIYHEHAVVSVPWPPDTIDELVATARALTHKGTYGLGVRVDGYWFVPFLRAAGSDLMPGGIDGPEAARALDRFAGLFGEKPVSLPRPLARDMPRYFREHKLAVVIEGPWAVAELTHHNPPQLGVAALPGAPRGGHLLVVPRCARNPRGAWALAAFLTEPRRQAAWARQLGMIPTTRDSLDSAGPFVRRFYEALRPARPLPRHPITPELFDDLTPAVEAVVAQAAKSAEALAGVSRAWQRLLRQHDASTVPPGPIAPETAR